MKSAQKVSSCVYKSYDQTFHEGKFPNLFDNRANMSLDLLLIKSSKVSGTVDWLQHFSRLQYIENWLRIIYLENYVNKHLGKYIIFFI